MNDFTQIQAQWREHDKRLREATDADREAIFDALAELGIEEVEIDFDGYGDSGQIDEVTVTGGSESLTGEVTVTHVPWIGPNEPRTCPLAEAVEHLCYGLLEHQHDGWQNNEGAYGTFYFYVDKRLVRLVFHQRYSDTETSFHDFGEV